jgi:hypothetical protein
MASTTFIDNQTTIFADWLNDANNAVYNGVFVSPTITATSMVCTGTASGAGFTNLVNNTFASPAAIGSATPNTGAFTTLTATTLTATTLTATGVTTPLPLKGTSSGTVSLAVPAVAGTNTITFPSGSGTVSVQGLSSNIVSGTAVASTSGTSIDFTGIPSWVKRITVMFNAVSLNSTGDLLIQLGTGSTTFTTSGYTSTALAAISGGNSFLSSTSGFIEYLNGAANIFSGHMVITNINGNNWVSSHVGKYNTGTVCSGAGEVSLGAVLTAVRITSSSGTDTFDAGSINILYE